MHVLKMQKEASKRALKESVSKQVYKKESKEETGRKTLMLLLHPLRQVVVPKTCQQKFGGV